MLNTQTKTPLRTGFLRSFIRWLVIGVVLLWSLAALILVTARWIDPPTDRRSFLGESLRFESVRCRTNRESGNGSVFYEVATFHPASPLIENPFAFGSARRSSSRSACSQSSSSLPG